MRAVASAQSHVHAVPLIGYVRARPLLLAWADSVGETLDVCPMPTPERWVYISGADAKPFKVGVTKYPAVRPFNSWRDYRLTPDTYPLILISDAGLNVERLIKRAGSPFCIHRDRWTSAAREAFDFNSPIQRLVGVLRDAADACFYQSEWFGRHEKLIEQELRWLRKQEAA